MNEIAKLVGKSVQVRVGTTWLVGTLRGPVRNGQSVPGGPEGDATGLWNVHIGGEQGARALEIDPALDIGNGGPAYGEHGFVRVLARPTGIRTESGETLA